MLNISFNLSRVNITCLVYFVKDDEDWFGYGKVNVFFVLGLSAVLKF